MAEEKILGFRIEIRGTQKQTSDMAKLTAETNRMKETVKLLNKIEKTNGTLTAKQAKQRQLLTTQIKANNSAYNQLNKKILQNSGVTKKNTSFTQRMGKSIVAAGAAMVGVTAIIGIATRVIGDAVRIVIEYEKANSKLRAVLRATDEDMESLTDQSKELGSTTAFTASEVTELQTEFAKLGFPTGEILKMTEATLDGAAALGSGLGEQAALTGALLKQYELDASKAGRVNDVLAESAASSALDFGKLSTALPIVGATANAAGVSLERTTALLGTLSDRGIDASTSGTALRNVFLQLSKQGLSFEEAMAKINVSTDKSKTAMELFGTRGATTGLILSQTAGSVEELEQKLIDAEGAAKEMADTMLDNVAGDVTKAKSAWEGFILSIEDGSGAISKSFRSIIQEGTGFLGILTDLNNGAISFEDGFKIALNTVMKGFSLLLKPLELVAEGIDAIAGTDIASAFDVPQLDLSITAIRGLDEAVKGLSLSQLEAKKVELAQLYIDAGLSAEEATKKIFDLIQAQKQLTKEVEADTSLEDKLNAEIVAGLEADKAAEKLQKKREADAKRASDKEIKRIQKLEEDKEKARAKGEADANAFLLEERRKFGKSERELAVMALEDQFQDKISKITGNSEAEKKLKIDLVAQEKLALDEQQLEFDIIDAEKKIEARQLELENQLILNQEDLEARRLVLEQQRVLELSQENLTESQRAVINKKFDDQITEEKRNAEQQRFDAQLHFAQASISILSSLSSLAQEGSAIAKSLALTEIAAKTGVGFIQALDIAQKAAAGTGPGAAFAFPIFYASQIASVLSAAAQAKSALSKDSKKDGGLVLGASHDQGGIQMYHKSGQHLGEMEGNEYIVSAKRTSEIGVDNLDAMNFGGSSPNLNGYFQDGGSVPSAQSSSAVSASVTNQANLEVFSELIAVQMQDAISRIEVTNNAVETANVANQVTNTETSLNFG